MSRTINFGIDLGTTNSAIAKYEGGNIIVFKHPSSLKETLPSVIAYRSNRIIIGDKAREMLNKSNSSVFSSFKRKMGSTDKFEINEDEFVTPVDLSAQILRELQSFIHTGESINSVVITIPAAFDTIQSNATKKAGYKAGFQEVLLLQEPIAATLAFANRSDFSIDQGKWLVYDLGGGTFDVALASVDDGEMKILDHEGDNFLGGSDFDRMIIDEFIIDELRRLGRFENLEIDFKSNRGKHRVLYHKLLFEAEEAKKTLSRSNSTDIEFEIEDDDGKLIDVFIELTREKFESLIRHTIDRTIEMISSIMLRNNLGQGDIKCILLIGGSTYIPLVRQSISQKYTIPVNSQLDPTTAVVVGAAYYAGTKPTQQKSIENVATNKETTSHLNLAYDRVSNEEKAPVIIKTNSSQVSKIRVMREDGAYDSGICEINQQVILYLPLSDQGYNIFYVNSLDKKGQKIGSEEIGISKGKFNIDGQPLPNDICLEVDALEDNTTFLEAIFKKNSILPLKKTIVKQVSNTIHKFSEEKLSIKVYEGPMDALPIANKLIGEIIISGVQLERDLIKGTDIELIFEITESRDLKVKTYLTLSDQEFENVFSPSEANISKSGLLSDLEIYVNNLLEKQKTHERTQAFENAQGIQEIINDIEILKLKVESLDMDFNTDEKFFYEIEKNNLGKRIYKFFNSSYLTDITNKYISEKLSTAMIILKDVATEIDKEEFEKITENDQQVLREGNIPVIKMKTDQLKNVSNRITGRMQISNEHYAAAFNSIRKNKFIDQQKADELINEGEDHKQKGDFGALAHVVNELYRMKESDNLSKKGFFKSDRTGLK